jgi:3-dehydroquinate synthase
MLPYDIVHSQNIAATVKDWLAKQVYTEIFVLTDENTLQYCYPLVQEALPATHKLFTVPQGEEHKHLATCTLIWKAMTDAGLDRKALLINLGGGVIGDMGGFCAATYKRGIDFVQIPTTLLSQVDASVGGKLGIDFEGFKNHLGVFQAPKAVLIDTVFLQTLPQRELRSGFAEVLKHCLIADKAHWYKLQEKTWTDNDWQALVAHSVEIKKNIVQADPYEKGLRKILNFGHTLGHAIESYFLERERLLHGEAIAIGMYLEAHIAYQQNLIDKSTLSDIAKGLAIYPRISLQNQALRAELLERMQQDKKNEGNAVKMVLLKAIGEAVYDCEVSDTQIFKALDAYEVVASLA